jgi:ketosteroid isomerase-like protein
MDGAIQTVIDKQAIHDLQVFYSMSIDSGDYDNLDDVFTPDVVSDYDHAGTHVGIEEIKDACRIALDSLTSAQHTNGNHWAEIDGDTARAGSYFTVHMYGEGTPGGEHFQMGGKYEDQLLRTRQGWRICRRSMRVLWSDGNRDVRFDR